VFADGSSSRRDDVGAWASIAVTATQRKILYGVEFPTTITRCELLPIIAGLRWVKVHWAGRNPGFRVSVYSDSEYTVRTLAGDYSRRKHKELWAALDEVTSAMRVTYIWRERNSTLYMRLCDAICGSLRKGVIHRAKVTFGEEHFLTPEALMPYEPVPDDGLDTSGANTDANHTHG
jgi:ribonuclease HI